MKPRLLDLFCCGGGAGMGYQRAGFDVTGVDIAPQPRYPFEFRQGDALEYLLKHGHEFDAIHASPPCQAYSKLAHLSRESPALIPKTRAALEKTGKLWVIENVVGSPLRDPKLLCGTMFNLRTKCGAALQRHRLFETNWDFITPACNHDGGVTIGIFGAAPRNTALEKQHYSKPKETRGRPPKEIVFRKSAAKEAMGIDWLLWGELKEAIPPAYTEFVGLQLKAQLK